MGLLDDIETEAAIGGLRDYGCTACAALERVTPEEQQGLRDALAGRLTVRAVLRLSGKYDLGVGRAGIIKHRREGH
jgi:hypothetical protein